MRTPNAQIASTNSQHGFRLISVSFYASDAQVSPSCHPYPLGVHRKLGPHITRVRSTKLDSWKQEPLEIIYSTGNKPSNDFYEFRLPTGFKKLDENASDKECTKFVNDKYIKKAYCPPNY